MLKHKKLLKEGGDGIRQSIGAGEGTGETVTIALHVAKAKPTRDPDTLLVGLDDIERDPDQPRTEFDELKLAELAESLKVSGQLQACLVRPAALPGRYVLICGERRFRAAQLAGLPHLVCKVDASNKPVADVLADQLVENLQRDDMNPVDLADALGRLRAAFGWSTRQIAERLGKSQSFVARSLALVDLSDAVRDFVRDGRLSASSAVILGRVENLNEQEELAYLAVRKNWTRDVVETMVDAKTNGFLAPMPDEPETPETAEVSHGDSESGSPRDLPGQGKLFEPEASHGDSPDAPAESEPDPEETPAAAPGSTSLVGPSTPKPGAVAASPDVTWGVDIPDLGYVFVELLSGRSRSEVAEVLRQALARLAAEETGATGFREGDAVRVIDATHMLHDREGTIDRIGPGGLLECRFPFPTQPSRKPLLWSCHPREVEKIRPAMPAKKGGRR